MAAMHYRVRDMKRKGGLWSESVPIQLFETREDGVSAARRCAQEARARGDGATLALDSPRHSKQAKAG